MDETKNDDERAPAGEEAVEEAAAEEHEAGCGRERCCAGKCHGLCGGIMSGAIVGAALALLLGPLKREKGPQIGASGEPKELRERIEEEGLLRAQVAVERVSGIARKVVSGPQSAWRTLRERLSDAWVEGKEGMTEGQEEARRKHEFMTKRRRPRR
jgi:gas vesicle protein